MARCVRGGLGAGQSDRPRPLHALQGVRQGMPGGGDRSMASRLTSTAAARIGHAWRRAARGCDRFLAPGPCAATASTWCSILHRSPCSPCPSRRRGCVRQGRDPVEQGACRPRARPPWSVSFEKPRFFAYKERICAPTRATRSRAAPAASTSARRSAINPEGDHGPRRAVPVHGLRRLRDRMPVRGDDLRLSAHGGHGIANQDGASDVPEGGGARRLPAVPTMGPTAAG